MRTKLFIALPSILLLLGALVVFSMQRVKASDANYSAELTLASTAVSIHPGDEFRVGLGLISPNEAIVGIDAILTFDSSLVDVVGVNNGTTLLKTLLPTKDNAFDLSSAVTLADQSDQSKLEFSAVGFDGATNTLTDPIKGTFDPITNPIAIISLKAKKAGQLKITFTFQSLGETTDSNVVAIRNGVPTDILAQPQATLFTIIPQSSPQPSPNPSATPQQVVSPRPAVSSSPTPSAVTPSPTPWPTSTPSAIPLVSPSPLPQVSQEVSASPAASASPVPSVFLPSATPTLDVSPSPSATPEPEGAQLQLTIGKTPYVGENFTVGVTLDVKQPIIGVDAVVMYDPRKLKVQKVQNKKLLDKVMPPENNGGSGIIRLSQLEKVGKAFTGTGTLAQLTFQPLVGGEQQIALGFGASSLSNVIAQVDGTNILSAPQPLVFTALTHATLTVQFNSPPGKKFDAQVTVGDVSKTLSVNASGHSDEFMLPDQLVGTEVTTVIKIPQYLPKRVTTQITSGTNALTVDELIGGDLNNDGIINALDLSLLYASWFGGGTGDLTADGVINTADYWVLYTNFLKSDE